MCFVELKVFEVRQNVSVCLYFVESAYQKFDEIPPYELVLSNFMIVTAHMIVLEYEKR